MATGVKAAHTPGPWVVAQVIGKARIQIVRVEHGCVQDIVVQRGGAMSLPNARLMAAAPEMLEALVTMCAVFGSQYGLTDSETAALNEARAAIAKAEGC